MLHRTRYTASLLLTGPTCPPIGLHFIVMALAAINSEDHIQLANPLYQRARALAEAEEMAVSPTAMRLYIVTSLTRASSRAWETACQL